MQFHDREILQGQLEHHEAGVLIHRYQVVEKIVRLLEQHLQISHATPDQAPTSFITTENTPVPTASNAPANVPAPTVYSASETVLAPAASRSPTTVLTQTSSNAQETLPDSTASNAPATVSAPPALNAPETVQAPTASSAPKTLPAPTWRNTSENFPAKSSCQPERGSVTTSGDAQITSGLGSLSIGGVVASASSPGSYIL